MWVKVDVQNEKPVGETLHGQSVQHHMCCIIVKLFSEASICWGHTDHLANNSKNARVETDVDGKKASGEFAAESRSVCVECNAWSLKPMA